MKKLNIFLIFPESDEDIFALGDDIDKYNNIIKELALIRTEVQNNYQFFYDSRNIDTFCNKANLLVTECYLDNIQTRLLHLLRKNATNIARLPLYKSDCCYFRWDDSAICPQTDNILRSATENHIDKKDEQTVVISFLYGDSWNRGILPMIKDAPHHQDLPILSNIPYFNPIETFIEWNKTRLQNRAFCLSNVAQFERTNKIWERSQRRIYKEKETGRYWYYDFYHKNNNEHYEVFDSNGEHIGEADTNGVVDTSKKDNTKSIHHILQ